MATNALDLPIRSTEPVTECGCYLGKAHFGQLRYRCHRPLTHVVTVGDDRPQAYGCEVHARKHGETYRRGYGRLVVVRPVKGTLVREIRQEGNITYREDED